MILQALNEYYKRMQTTHPGELAEFGFERKAIPVIIELTETGDVHQISIDADKNTNTAYILPKAVKRASNVAANLLWDNAEYALGLMREGGKLERVVKQHQAFIDRMAQLNNGDIGLQAVMQFLGSLDLQILQQRADFDEEFFQRNPNVSFKLASDVQLICERGNVRDAIRSARLFNVDDAAGICLITGQKATPERLHPSIKGVWDAQTSGANIVSVNNEISKSGSNQGQTPAFSSYKKQQAYNSPISIHAAFSYTEALNYLLRKGSPQRTQVGDASTVFWSEKGHTEIENAFLHIMAIPEKASKKDDPNKNARKVSSALGAFYRGSRIAEEDNQSFYVLGLSPNVSRIAIRFWKVVTIKELAKNICQHFQDINICHPPKEYPAIPLPRLLSHLCLEYKLSNLPSNLSGEVVRSILDNSPYPYTLLAAAVRRNKAEQKVSFPRAAIIKACLNRQIRQSQLSLKELTMALDLTNTDTPYLLGRWFATLEKIQEDSHPGINATIKDRYYGAISSNPVNVFSILDRLKNHHLGKLKIGHRINKERLLGQIIDQLPAKLPNHFSLQEQGCFAIGYYHQRQDFYRPKESSAEQSLQLSNSESGE